MNELRGGILLNFEEVRFESKSFILIENSETVTIEIIKETKSKKNLVLDKDFDEVICNITSSQKLLRYRIDQDYLNREKSHFSNFKSIIIWIIIFGLKLVPILLVADLDFEQIRLLVFTNFICLVIITFLRRF